MDYELDDQEKLLIESLGNLTSRHGKTPSDHTGSWFYGDRMDAELVDNGFLGIAREEGFGVLQAALIVEHVARQPAVVETGASALVVPQLLPEDLPRPVALVDARDGYMQRPVRFLDRARSAVVDLGDDVAVLSLDPGDVEPIDSFLAYPMGRLRTSDVERMRRLGPDRIEPLRQWWRVANALEIAGGMAGALDRTVAYVRERRAFGREIGSFQAVQHRLAACAQLVHSSRWLALEAADTGSAADAVTALAYAQESAATLYYDTHQFTGAIGLTFEYPLHYWSLRLKVLQAELGGDVEQYDLAASAVWS